MKKAKLMTILVVALIVLSCKKTEMLSSTEQTLTLDKLGPQTTQFNTVGLCESNFIQGMRTFISNWGIGSSSELNRSLNPYFLSDRLAAHNAVYETFRDCGGNGAPGTGGALQPAERKIPFLYFMSPGNLADWLNFLDAYDLCDQTKADEIKTFIAPLNAIIKRTIDDVGASYYSSIYDEDDRFEMIIMHFYASEAALLDVSHASGNNHRAFLYLKSAANLFKIPNVIANKLFNKPLTPNIPVGGNPDVEQWEGFLVDLDPGVNNLSTYCNPILTPPIVDLIFPTPSAYHVNLPSIIWPTISFETPIYLNGSDHKYYTEATFINLVPNGFYKHPNNLGNNLVHHIVNGQIVEVVPVHSDPNVPIEG